MLAGEVFCSVLAVQVTEPPPHSSIEHGFTTKVPVGGDPAAVISVIYIHPNPSEPAFY